jgi:hypothetical protein
MAPMNFLLATIICKGSGSGLFPYLAIKRERGKWMRIPKGGFYLIIYCDQRGIMNKIRTATQSVFIEFCSNLEKGLESGISSSLLLRWMEFLQSLAKQIFRQGESATSAVSFSTNTVRYALVQSPPSILTTAL